MPTRSAGQSEDSPAGIPLLGGNGGVDELLVRALGAGSMRTRMGKQHPVLWQFAMDTIREFTIHYHRERIKASTTGSSVQLQGSSLPPAGWLSGSGLEDC